MNECYWKKTFKASYKTGLQPINGQRWWPKADGIAIKPPLFKTKPERPRKNRRKDKDKEPKLKIHINCPNPVYK